MMTEKGKSAKGPSTPLYCNDNSHSVALFFYKKPSSIKTASKVKHMNRPGTSSLSTSISQLLSLITGQPPQRPPSLGPAPGIGGPFRGPYPTYGIPPRNIVPGYPAPGLQNHRTTQSLVPQSTPGAFAPPRTPAGFPFGGTNPQQQQQTQSQQSHPQLPIPPHQQQQPPTSAHPSLSHLQGTTPSISGGGTASGGGGGTAPSVSSTSELGLDPNDFPALGATPPTATSTTNTTPATSYASQAGTGVPTSSSSGGASGGSALPRDFTADDFPALGGGPAPSQQPHQQPSQQQQAQPQSQSSPHDNHPPGLSGLPGNQQQQQQQPGLLNLGPRALQGLQSETEKQRVRDPLSPRL
jgi:CCR4-NOT transcription complex subunit 2